MPTNKVIANCLTRESELVSGYRRFADLPWASIYLILRAKKRITGEEYIYPCSYSCAAICSLLLVFIFIWIDNFTSNKPEPLMCGVVDFVNDRPIIGILSQEASYLNTKFPKQNYTSYIAASYVKDVEASGARVVPIMIGKNRTYYHELMSKINGILLPGGGTSFNASNGYADAGQHIFEIAKQFNDEGLYFPVFGICLGFELLIVLDSGRGDPENRVKCSSYEPRSLNFTNDYHDSRMFKDAPDDIVNLLQNSRVTVNAHHFCIVEENLKSHNLTDHWRVTSHSEDDNGFQFIATIEHKNYPFYGVQFHPEKSAFEWKRSKNYPRTAEAIKANRYFMDFFVNECRNSYNSFPNPAEENLHLIYNYSPYFTGFLGSAYQQCYLFEPRGIEAESSVPKILSYRLRSSDSNP